MSITKLLLITVSCLITATNAQYPYRRRRSFGSAIAGAIVGASLHGHPMLKSRLTDSVFPSGAIALLLMICLVCLLMRRRRARGNVGGIGPQPGFVSKPMFGGPWNRSNVVPPQNGAHTSPYIHHGNPNSSQAPSQSYNPEYPPRNTSLPPPAYGKDAEYKGEYQPVRVFYLSTF